jgi:LysM domain
MHKVQNLALGFIIAGLMGVSPSFAQASTAPQAAATSADVGDLSVEQLEDEIHRLESENEQLREELRLLRSDEEPQEDELVDTQDIHTQDIREDDIMDTRDRPTDASEATDTPDTSPQEPSLENANHTVGEREPIIIGDDLDKLPSPSDIDRYNNLIDSNITPYEKEPAQQLHDALDEVGALIESDEDAALELWQDFIVLFVATDEEISIHLIFYQNILAELQAKVQAYLLEAPLHEIRKELSDARVAYNESDISKAVEHLEKAQALWQDLEADEAQMDLLDKHLETAIAIEILSRRFARGENAEFSKPSAWNSDTAESSPIDSQDIEPQFMPLHRAIILWEQASYAAEEGNMSEAARLLDQSRMHINFYSGVSFNSYHTVRLNVARRESLWRIAAELYGNGFMWTRLWDANRDVIEDPEVIYPGQQLGVPTPDQILTTPEEVAAYHATDIQTSESSSEMAASEETSLIDDIADEATDIANEAIDMESDIEDQQENLMNP